MNFEIKHRWTGNVLFTAELDASFESESYRFQLGAAIKLAIKARANLAGAYLAGANLAGAYLARANLAGAYLAGAYLAGANLARANLAGANLARAYLAGANLAGANLDGANLACADGEKITLVGRRPVIWYGPVGRESRTVYAFLTDHGVYVRAGCFWGTLDKFKSAVVDTHGGSDHGTEYQAFIDLTDTHFKLFAAPEIREAAE